MLRSLAQSTAWPHVSRGMRRWAVKALRVYAGLVRHAQGVADLLMGATSSELQQLAVCAGSLEAAVGVGGQDCTFSGRPTYGS